MIGNWEVVVVMAGRWMIHLGVDRKLPIILKLNIFHRSSVYSKTNLLKTISIYWKKRYVCKLFCFLSSFLNFKAFFNNQKDCQCLLFKQAKKMIKSVSNESSIGRGAQRLSNGHIFFSFCFNFQSGLWNEQNSQKKKEKTDGNNQQLCNRYYSNRKYNFPCYSFIYTYVCSNSCCSCDRRDIHTSNSGR